MRPANIALICWILPLSAVHIAYAISLYEHNVPVCIPYFEGCVSISRAARNGNALYVFRATMIAFAIFLVWYWHLATLWLKTLAPGAGKSVLAMFIIGSIGAGFLILYADFLGEEGVMYRLLRLYGIVVFFGLTPFAQLLQMHVLFRYARHQTALRSNRLWLNAQLILCSLMLLLGVGSVILDALYLDSDEIENIIEWNFALLMNFFFIGSFFIWRRMGFDVVAVVEKTAADK